MITRLSLFADYFQIVLADDAVIQTPELMTDADIDRRMIVAQGVVVLFTARNMFVPVEIAIHQNEPPPLDLGAWDHVVEGSLALPSGRVAVFGLTEPDATARRFATARGVHRLRAASAGLDTLSANRLEGEDRYRVDLWPAPQAPVKVLKQYRT